jgi:L-seryl-tRNA(Ser) seleniumtransferase
VNGDAHGGERRHESDHDQDHGHQDEAEELAHRQDNSTSLLDFGRKAFNTVGVKLVSDKAELYRKLPSIDELLRRAELRELIERDGVAATTEAARTVLACLREAIAHGELDANAVELAVGNIVEVIERQLKHELRHSLRPVINATGVVLHTNLGRAPLSPSALEHIRETASVFSNLEFDLEAGERGKRDVHVDRLFARLLQPFVQGERAVSTIVVNNNAAAVMIALNTLAEGGEVIVSRGELVEIGGSFRVPDVMAKSQATLREVGTTNRTRILDYEKAINERTRLLMRVHRSNFEIVGFTEQPSLEELVALSRKYNIPVMEDLGSGALFDLREVGIQGEPGVGDSIAAGVDVVTYSGDKLLGGPQAGMISGRRDLVSQIRKNPLFRALRVDKLIYAALEATLLTYVKRDFDTIPALKMMRASKEDIGRRAEAMASELKSAGLSAELRDGESVIGGGSAPGSVLPTVLISIAPERASADDMANQLRHNDPPVVARVVEDRVVVDLRTVMPEQDPSLAMALKKLK